MAGDWIKMRTGLRRHPKVVQVSSALNADRLRVIGALHAVWSVFDEHSVDGTLHGYTVAAMDAEIGFPGFCAAMIAVNWLADNGQELEIPRSDEHNGQSAKRRAQETDRKKNARNMSASGADKKRTREEKRREEEKKEPPTPLQGARKKREPGIATKMADGWSVPSEWIAEAAAKIPAVDWAAEALRFVAHHDAKGSKFEKWKSAWATWVNNPYPKTPAKMKNGAADLPDFMKGAI